MKSTGREKPLTLVIHTVKVTATPGRVVLEIGLTANE